MDLCTPERKRTCCYGTMCCMCLWVLIVLITIFASMRTLGAEDQILVEGPTGKYVINGPSGVFLVHPFRTKTDRKATRLGPRNYAVVKNLHSGLIRHEAGPQVLFLGAWDHQLEVNVMETLQKNEYMRFVDTITGYETIEYGPKTFVPQALTYSPRGKKQGIVISGGKSVLTLNKTIGTLVLEDTEGLFMPKPYQDVIEERKPIVVGPTKYAKLKDLYTGSIRHVQGPVQLKLGAYEELMSMHDKVVLQKNEYARLIDEKTGLERVVIGPMTLIPNPGEVSATKEMRQTGINIGADTAVLVLDLKTGKERLVETRGIFFPAAYEEIVEIRRARLIGPKEFAIVRSLSTGVSRMVQGPVQLKIKEYEELVEVKEKVVLQKDEYVRLVDKSTGTERVMRGPATFVPNPEEEMPDGTQRAVFIDRETSLLVLNRDTGDKQLIERSMQAESERGGYIPKAYQKILGSRTRITVLPHETVIVRDNNGSLKIKSGAGSASERAFFLQPNEARVSMQWSEFTQEFANGKNVPKVNVDTIEMRVKKIFFAYIVRTSDNVELSLEGTIFWKVNDVAKMIQSTDDPEGDVWSHARSAMIQAVSKVTLSVFMNTFNNITATAFSEQAADGFYSFRGIEAQSMQVTKYDCVDAATAAILQEIIEAKAERLKAVQVQQSANEAALSKVVADTTLEQQQTQLIQSQSDNTILLAKAEGEAFGLKELKDVTTFLDGLAPAVADQNERVKIFEMREKLAGRSKDIANLNTGKLKLFYAPKTMDIRMDMTGKPDTDRRLQQDDPAKPDEEASIDVPVAS
eukprot:TRINITY_DN17423_c0_g1_i1.p1 TRINITY_DN17423_c0_g1~~TRINITY_DN17423_c0_g1_i1.p1  ORF type:complete len:802 (-),score=229.84 TRINITY_DN17423_c0_g1_i1:119-2524(-)